MRLRHVLIALAALVVGAGLSTVAGAQTGGTPPTTPTTPTGTVTNPTTTTPTAVDPCSAKAKPRLRCPDLVMYAPQDVYAETVGGRVLLHSDNHIVNKGPGPAELNAVKVARMKMKARQRVYKVAGGSIVGAYRGTVYFKAVPGQYRYWKWVNAARMEIWTIAKNGKPGHLVRTSPKQIFCLRDLNRRTEIRSTVSARHYPGCSQNPNITHDVLGTSVGWSDDYPSGYNEQYTDVTGLHGKFFLIHTADPKNVLIEANEDNNRTLVRVTLK
jgi:hypothetical protein